ncbi:MAG: hypothetical protein ACYCZM_10590 [Acidimicrobiales bacterium]
MNLLPTGFSRTYDPAIASLPDGTVLIVAGAAPSGAGACLPHSSVTLARAAAPGKLAMTAPILVDDERPAPAFDDRPAIAASSTGTIWVAWSQGEESSVCQLIGSTDRVFFVTSSDGGRTFTTKTALPQAGEGGAFGVRIVPVGADQAVMSWTEVSPDGGSARVVTMTVSANGAHSAPQVIWTGPAVPRLLPGASFDTYTLASLTTFGPNGLAMAWPTQSGGAAVVDVALSPDGGTNWSVSQLAPAPGFDLVLPELAYAGDQMLLLVYAQHGRSGDTVSYQARYIGVRTSATFGPAAALTPALPGPGYLELGEFLFLSSVGSTITGSVVAGQKSGAALLALTWPVQADPKPASSNGAVGAVGKLVGVHPGLLSYLVFGLLILALITGIITFYVINRQSRSRRGRSGPSRRGREWL